MVEQFSWNFKQKHSTTKANQSIEMKKKVNWFFKFINVDYGSVLQQKKLNKAENKCTSKSVIKMAF